MNSSLHYLQDSLGYTTLICDVLMAFTTCVGLTGNIMICVVIYKTKSLQTYINATLVCSSVVDIIGCSFLLPVRIYVYTFPLAHFDILQICCQLGIFLRNLCDCVKLFMLTVGSFERYRAVVQPFKKEGRVKRTIVLMSLSWFIAIIFSSFSVVFFKDTTLYVHCFIEPNTISEQWGKHDVFLILPLGLFCLTAIFIFYTLILVTLFKHSSIMKKRLNKGNKIHPVEQNHNNEKDKKEYLPKIKIPTIIIDSTTSSQQDIIRFVSGTVGSNKTEWTDIEKESCPPLETGEEHANITNNDKHCYREADHQTLYSKYDLEYKTNKTDTKSEHSNKDLNQGSIEDGRTKIKNVDIDTKDTKNSNERKEVNYEQIESVAGGNMDSDSSGTQGVKEKESNVRHNYLSKTNDEKNKTENFLTLDTKVHFGKAFYVGNNTTKIDNSGNKEIKGSDEQYNQSNNEILLKTKSVTNVTNQNNDNNFQTEKYCEDGKGDTQPITKDKVVENETSGKKLESGNELSKMEVVNEAKDIGESKDENKENESNKESQNNNLNNAKENKEQRRYSKTVQVFDIEGKVKIGKTNNEAVVGAVCVMNSKNRIQGRRKVEMRAAKRILILIGTFILCWLPLPVFVLCVGDTPELNLLEVQLVIIFGTVNGLNMAINPIQYAFCNRQIHSAFKNLYSGCWANHY